MDHPIPDAPEPPDPQGTIARRTLLGVMGAAFGGALGVAVLGATRNLPAAAATVAAPTATPQPTMDHSLHAVAPTPSGSPVDHDALHQATTAAFPAKTKGLGLQELPSKIVDGAREFELTCGTTKWEVTPGHVMDAIAYNDQVPGPIIRVTEGERVRVKVLNKLSESTAVHWHGQRVPNSQDGVPFITQPPIKPGATHVYEFTAGPFGSHMYHSHHNATEQVGLGMLGPLIVVPKARNVDPSYEKDELFILNDALGGFTINGKGFPATCTASPSRSSPAMATPSRRHSSATRSTSRQASGGTRSSLPTRSAHGRSTATSSDTPKVRPACSGWSPRSSCRPSRAGVHCWSPRPVSSPLRQDRRRRMPSRWRAPDVLHFMRCFCGRAREGHKGRPSGSASVSRSTARPLSPRD